jgi:hypothetical protein
MGNWACFLLLLLNYWLLYFVLFNVTFNNLWCHLNNLSLLKLFRYGFLDFRNRQCCVFLYLPVCGFDYYRNAYLMYFACYFCWRRALQYSFLNFMLAGVTMSESIASCTSSYLIIISGKSLLLLSFSFIDISFLDPKSS